MNSEIKSDRGYTKDHEWAKREGSEVTVGITAYAVEQLGDVTLVNIDVREGDTIEEGKPFGTVESVKTLADLFAPVKGKVVRINGDLEDKPELINDDCYGTGWMIAIEPSNPSDLDALLDADAYGKLLASH